MQVTDVSAGKRYIGNIANPQLIGRGWDKALYQVLPLMVTMVGIGCAPGFAGRKHQAVSTKQRVEAVATGHEPLSEEGGEHDPQLVTTDTGILATYLTYGIQHETFILHMAPYVSLGLVIGLTTMAKQTAGWRYFHLAKPDQFRYYLAPGFFLMGMLKYSSARVIIKSRASLSNREKARAFSNSLTRFLSRAFSSW